MISLKTKQLEYQVRGNCELYVKIPRKIFGFHLGYIWHRIECNYDPAHTLKAIENGTLTWDGNYRVEVKDE